jgi:iron-sulfur cluster assembly protein
MSDTITSDSITTESLLNASSEPALVQTQLVTDIVAVTETALVQFRDILSKDVNACGIRLGVAGGGCAGLTYQMNPCDTPIDGDLVQEVGDVKFYIHPMAAAYLKGTQLDYSHSMMESGFKFINPNAASTCGCGTSFGV